MIIIWYEDLIKVNRIFDEITKNIGGTVEGPYYPQTEALMYIFKVKNYEWLNQCGRIFLKRAQEEGVKITPVRYEVAVTAEEFWEK